jgi:hypothetical protein
MLRQFLVGAVVSVCNIVIHALVMTAVVRVTRRRVRIHPAGPITGARKASRQSQRLIYISVATISVLMAAHACEVIVWSLLWPVAAGMPRRDSGSPVGALARLGTGGIVEIQLAIVCKP